MCYSSKVCALVCLVGMSGLKKVYVRTKVWLCVKGLNFVKGKRLVKFLQGVWCMCVVILVVY